MTYYDRSAYGSTNPNAGRPANGDTAAWGGYEWPNCPPSSLMGQTDYTTRYGQRLRVSVRKEIVELTTLMFKICDKHNYTVYAYNNGEAWGPWGFECRSISGSNNPSGHSKALSIDINAPYNPYSYTFQSNMPPAMVHDLEAIGYYWGGRYENQKYDAMHFGYCYRPADVAGHVAKAKAILGDSSGTDTDDNGGTDTYEEMDMYLAKTQDSKGRDVWATVDASGCRYINDPSHLADLQKSGMPQVRVKRDWYNANRAPGTGSVG